MKLSIRTGVFQAFVVLFLFLFAMTPAVSAGAKIVVGSKNLTEQRFLSRMAALLLEKAGFAAELRTGTGSAEVRGLLENGQIDLYYEYTGTAYTVFYRESDRKVMGDGPKVYQWVKKYDARKGLVWLDPVGLNNTFTLMMRAKQAGSLGIATISGLSNYINTHPDKLVVGVSAALWERTDGVKPLLKRSDAFVYLTFQNTYLAEEFKPFTRADDLRFPYAKVKKLEAGLVSKALRDSNVDVAMGFATDGGSEATGLATLKDDKRYFPAYNPAPVIRAEILKANPNIETILKPLAEKLTTEEIRRLNADVDIRKKDVSETARSWLAEKGLL